MISQHRHRDLCWALDIAPYRVVIDFAEASVMTQNIIAELVPRWNKPVPEPVKVPEPETTPRAKRIPAGARLSIRDKPTASGSGDVDMEDEEADVPALSLASKGKGSVLGDRSEEDVDASESISSGTRATGRKRSLPPPVQESVKRQKKKKGSRRAIGLDLGDQTFDEDSPISVSLVPGLAGKVRRDDRVAFVGARS
jgi:hypothetical protein